MEVTCHLNKLGICQLKPKKNMSLNQSQQYIHYKGKIKQISLWKKLIAKFY